jgi:archaellum component FlaG (FlaF/FlaG flagellin family)
MKKLFLIACCAAAFTACQNNSKTNGTSETAAVANPSSSTENTAIADPDAPKVEVEKAVYEFGEIKQGEKVSYTFKFKNIGKTPLIITNASATCGCTQPEYQKEPIKPGEEGTIQVTFNSAGKEGLQDKVVTITSNANPAFEQLHLVGNVKK